MKNSHLFVFPLLITVCGGCALTEIDECHGDVKTCQDNKLMRCTNGHYELERNCEAESLVCDPNAYQCAESLVCERGCDGRYIRDCENGKSKITDCGDGMVCVNRESKGYVCESAVKCREGIEVYDKETNSCDCNREGHWIEQAGKCVCEGDYKMHGTVCDTDLNGNHMWDSEEVANAQGQLCRKRSECFSAADRDEDKNRAFCDSFLGDPKEGARCSTRCTENSQCVDTNIYYCRGDGRCVPRIFETVWRVVNDPENDENDKTVAFPAGTECNYFIDWGDDSPEEHITSCLELEHQYGAEGDYHVRVTGVLDGWKCGDMLEPDEKTDDEPAPYIDPCEAEDNPDTGDEDEPDEDEDDDDDADVLVLCDHLVEVVSFGPVGLGEFAFAGSDLEKISHVDIPDSVKLTTLKGAFFGVESFNDDISNWDTSSVNDMSYFMMGASKFNHSLNHWNTSNVEDMAYAFYEASQFNSDISKWDVVRVTDMEGMFGNALAFNQNIAMWETENVENMSYMFEGAIEFNQPITDWDTSSVEHMKGMFKGAVKFNQPLEWNVSRVDTFDEMFSEAKAFNQELEWDTESARSMKGMFMGASAFNKRLIDWDTSKVETMERMFQEAENFNQDIGYWETFYVVNMKDMFAYATSFNQNIGRWDVGSVDDMSSMFEGAEKFNQPLNAWDVSKVTSMTSMFEDAVSFNQPLDKWDVGNVFSTFNMFKNAKAFDQDLSSWTMNGTCYRHMFESSKLGASEKVCTMLKDDNWCGVEANALGLALTCH